MDELVAMIKNIQLRFDEQTKELRDMKQSIPQTINNYLDTKFENFELRFLTLEKTIEDQGRRIQQLERQTRKKNIIFFGIEENERNYYNLQEKVLEIMNKYMEIKYINDNIEEVRRLGKKQDGKTRPTIVTFNTMGKKIELLKNKKKLNESSYYIKEDFPPEILEERKKLGYQLMEERNKGRIAYLRYNKLIVIPEDKQTHQYKQNPNKRNLSESPENNDVNYSKNRTKKAIKKPYSNNIHQYMVKNPNLNRGPPLTPTTPTS